MKQILLLVTCIASFTLSVSAQVQDTFDIATFRPPVGWKKQTKEGVLIYITANEKKGTYAMITLYQSGKSTGDAGNDFAADWQQFAVGQLGVKAKPEIDPVAKAEGWTITSGGAAFKNTIGDAVMILFNFSGLGRSFSVTAVFNSQDDLPAITGFVESIQSAGLPTVIAPAADSDGAASILGTWSASASGTQRYDDYKNPYATNGYGYSKHQYTFNANGTYSFVAKTFRMTFDKLLLVREAGTYQVAGANITITPQKSVIEAWSKQDGTDKWGTRLTTQSRKLEKVTYRFTKHYFSGIQIWNLVLQADTPTERDGPFSSNTTFANAWYYAPISANNTAIDLPR